MSSNGLTYTFTKGIRVGACVMSAMGTLSALTVFLLLLHLIHVAFIPNAPNLRYLLSREPKTAEPEITRSRVNILSNSSGDRKLNGGEPSNATIPVSQRQAHGRQQPLLQGDRMAKDHMILPVQLGLFITCLLLADLLQALGVLIELRWVHLGGVQDGKACWMQASLITFGDVASGVWNAIIAIHTFSTVCLGIRMTTPIVFVTMLLGWGIPLLMNVIGSAALENISTRGHYYGVAGAWCFITNRYDVERAWLHYAPMLAAAGVITLMYIPVFLRIRGNLVITPSPSDWSGYRFTFRSSPQRIATGSTMSGGSSTHLRTVANKVLWYPISFIALLLPTVVCRFKAIYGSPVPLPVLIGCISLLSTMGFTNVCIYFFTRNLGGTQWFARPSRAKQNDMEVFVERTINQTGPVPRGDNGRIQATARHISAQLYLDTLRIPAQSSDLSLGAGLYPDLEAKAMDVEVDEPPTPISKHALLHDLIFRNSAPPSPISPEPELGGTRVEQLGTSSHDERGKEVFYNTLQPTHSTTTHEDPST